MTAINTSLRKFAAGLALLTILAAVTVLLFSVLVVVGQRNLIYSIAQIALIVGFWGLILLFIRRSKPAVARHLGDQPATILEVFLGSIAVLIMFFVILEAVGVDPQSLLTGAGFATITIGLIISTFVGGILAGALVFATHTYRVGDSVVVNNVPGTVTELTALVTRIRTDLGVMTIPNSAISSGSIVITRLHKMERIPQQRLPYNVGDRVVTTYLTGGQGAVKELTALRTVIAFDSGLEVTFLNSSVLTGTIAVAKVTGQSKRNEASP